MTNSAIEQAILAALRTVIDPQHGQDIVTLGMVSGLQVDHGHAVFALEVDAARGPALEPLRQKAEQASIVPGVTRATVVLTSKRAAEPPAPRRTAKIENLAPSVRHIIAVASGKGGVGKSTVAVNLAVALAALGLRTGLLDADIYGPSVHRMLGLTGKPDFTDAKVNPHQAHGIKAISMGFMVDEEAAMIWRGPMIQTALRQFLQDVNWGDLDILVVDMPPGTGDAQLTMAQKVPLAGAVIVSTPQDIALLDARRAVSMFRQVHVPILGMVENMSVFVCSNCGHAEHIFGAHGARDEAARIGCDFLGALPLEAAIRVGGDEGTPFILRQPDSPGAAMFATIASGIAESLKLL